LIKRYQAHSPNDAIVLTTMTPTGSERAQKILGDYVYHMYVPYDYPRAVKRFLQYLQPSILVLMETELWPNLIHYSRQMGASVILANARLSPASISKYHKVSWILTPFFHQVNLVAAQSEDNAQRFRQIGFKPAQINVLGNLKYDLTIDPQLMEQAQTYRQQAQGSRPTWIAGSTHEGEETVMLEAFQNLKQHIPSLLLILVPRHPQRFEQVAELCQKHQVNFIRRSQQSHLTDNTEVLLVDKMGELGFMYACSDVAFIGGSLVAHGGHNPLESIAVNVPAITGPHTFNFTEVYEQLTQQQGVRFVHDVEQLQQAVRSSLQDSEQAATLVDNGQKVLELNQGAIDRHIQVINEKLHRHN